MGIITDDQVQRFAIDVDRWASERYRWEWNREAGVNADPEDVDAAYTVIDRLGLAWRRQLDVLVAGTGADADQIARDIHKWGAARAELARRSSVSVNNPGRHSLGQVQLDGETESHAALLRWTQPLYALVDADT